MADLFPNFEGSDSFTILIGLFIFLLFLLVTLSFEKLHS